MSRHKKVSLKACLSLILASQLYLTAETGFASDCSLSVSNPTASANPPGAMVRAVYLSLTNNCDSPVVITDVEAIGFVKAGIHQTRIDAGVSSMHHIHSLEIAAGETLDLTPGGLHIMLMKPIGESNSTITVKLLMEGGKSMTISIDSPT